MLAAISEKAKSDAGLTALFSRAAEYAEVYLLAKKRQKGCDGMGELATLKDEFRGVVDEVMGYCREKNYLAPDSTYDIDAIAEEFAGW
jgi:hypothetical protein